MNTLRWNKLQHMINKLSVRIDNRYTTPLAYIVVNHVLNEGRLTSSGFTNNVGVQAAIVSFNTKFRHLIAEVCLSQNCQLISWNTANSW